MRKLTAGMASIETRLPFLGGKVGIAPRIFLRKLVATILDRVNLFPDFDPQKDLDIRIDADELTVEEQAAVAGKTPDDIEIDM